MAQDAAHQAGAGLSGRARGGDLAHAVSGETEPRAVGHAAAAGILLGAVAPGVSDALNSISVGTTNIPLAICMMLMLYPPLAKVRYAELPKVFRNVRALGLMLLFCAVIGPLLMFLLATTFLRDQPEYMTGLILIGIAPCIAMVIVWNGLAGGDAEWCAGFVAVNAILQVLLYGPMAWLFATRLTTLVGAPSVSVSLSVGDVAGTVAFYLGIPFAAGALAAGLAVALRKRTN